MAPAGPSRLRTHSDDSVPVEYHQHTDEDHDHIVQKSSVGGVRPLDRTSQRKALEGRFREAQANVARKVVLPLKHGLWSIFGLLAVELLRILSWWQGSMPGWSVFGLHFLTTSSDVVCICSALPLFAMGIKGQCVQMGCLGPMLTLVFAMCMVDLSAFGAFLVVATPRPLSPGARSYIDVLEACVGVWEFALIASVGFQVVLSTSSWRVYKELRGVGLYPPGAKLENVGQLRPVSMLEVVCEAEDVELLTEFEIRCPGSDSATKPLSLCASRGLTDDHKAHEFTLVRRDEPPASLP